MSASLSIHALRKVFAGLNGQAPATILDGLDLNVPAGSFVSLVGLNGSGKTTLLRLIAGLDAPTTGEIRINGELAGSGPRPVGMVSQELALLPWRTTLGNVELGLELQGMARHERWERAMDMLRLFGLEGCASQYPRELSGGMRQKAAIARALVAGPELLLMDEPFSALDCQIRSRLQRFLVELWTRRRDTVLFVTHDIEEAVILSDTVVVISQAPTRVLEVISVDMPRPRERTAVRTNELRRRVLSVLKSMGEVRR